jgi:hypothetical protein
MKFHDYHLNGYLVLESGSRIILELSYDYPGVDKKQSRIEFSDVVCYHFKHTTGAIITDITEVDVSSLVKAEVALLSSFAHDHGLTHWRTDAVQYADTLSKERMRAWSLESAIGFSGFVIGRTVEGTP